MNYFRQIFYEMKHQKMMTWVSISGTALAIFLVMTFFMTDNVKRVELAPESNRQKYLVASGLHFQTYNEAGEVTWSRASGLSYKKVKELYSGLDGVKKEACLTYIAYPVEVSVGKQRPLSIIAKPVDSDFWSFFDFNFIYGQPYDRASCEAGELKAVISQSSARKLFKEDDVVGREIKIGDDKYRICGVIADVDPLLNLTYSNIYFPISKQAMESDYPSGNEIMMMMPEEGVDLEHIKNQVKGRYANWNSQLSVDVRPTTAVYHDTPWDIDIWSGSTWVVSDDPKPARSKTTTYLIYGLLIILPAINLSSMTKGRLRHRVSEIGVRRAFGAKRKSIVWQLLGENLIITLLGGIIGLIVCLLFMHFASSFLFQFSSVKYSTALDLLYSTPSLSMLFTWENFFFALGMCLLLNILSTTVPAWRASRMEPAVAIAKIMN